MLEPTRPEEPTKQNNNQKPVIDHLEDFRRETQAMYERFYNQQTQIPKDGKMYDYLEECMNWCKSKTTIEELGNVEEKNDAK